jgi:hypothetical protein
MCGCAARRCRIWLVQRGPELRITVSTWPCNNNSGSSMLLWIRMDRWEWPRGSHISSKTAQTGSYTSGRSLAALCRAYFGIQLFFFWQARFLRNKPCAFRFLVRFKIWIGYKSVSQLRENMLKGPHHAMSLTRLPGHTTAMPAYQLLIS